MNSRKIDLAIAFLQSQPSSAAGVLEQQSVEQVAMFLSEISYAHAAMALGNMLPQYAARICQHVEPAVAAAFMSEMDASLVAAIMRHLDSEKSLSILELLPEKTKLLCMFLLYYQEDAVGAWMIANPPVVPCECTIEEARERFITESLIDIGVIHIVDRDRHLHGVLGISTLFSAAPSTQISTVMDTNFATISGRASVKSAIEHPGWSRCDTLAVNNRSQKFVGVIRHVDLRRGLKATSNIVSKPLASDPLSGIYEVYGKSLLALLNTFGEAVSSGSKQ